MHNQHDLDYPYILDLKILLHYDRNVEIQRSVYTT